MCGRTGSAPCIPARRWRSGWPSAAAASCRAVFALLVALEVEQGSLTPALITVPVLMVVAAAALVLGRFLRGRAQQSNESRNA